MSRAETIAKDPRPRAAGRARSRPRLGGSRRGWSLIEVMVVLIVMGILISMSAPSFRLAMEQTRADIAGANLRAMWAAQRLYWLENHTYSTDLNELTTLGLIDPSVASSTTVYVYAVQSADATTFTATATRTGSAVWSGNFLIDQTGVLSGVVVGSGQPNLIPGFQ